ncbi:hypothetical protein HOY80DRAFT_1133973 [Tuber brumale]|nr:hypothetical protein HOY80DRAFT_1133973 [Tuber brumale]
MRELADETLPAFTTMNDFALTTLAHHPNETPSTPTPLADNTAASEKAVHAKDAPVSGNRVWPLVLGVHITLFNVFGYAMSYRESGSYYAESVGVTPYAINVSVRLALAAILIPTIIVILIATFGRPFRLSGGLAAIYSAATFLYLGGIPQQFYRSKSSVDFIWANFIFIAPSAFILPSVTISLVSMRFNNKDKFLAIGLALSGAATGGIMVPLAVQRLCPWIGRESLNWVLVVVGVVTLLCSNVLL